MKLYLGVTDFDWYRFLAQSEPDEVNFWRPSAKQPFKVIDPASLFLFKLKAPHNKIGGGAFFQRYARLPVSLAWEAFGQKNGVTSQHKLREKILSYRNDSSRGLADPEIGCIILIQPFFFPREEWIDIPDSFKPNLVQGKSYDTTKPEGKAIFDAVTDRLTRYDFPPSEKGEPVSIVAEPVGPRYGNPVLTQPRLGQGAFRVEVLEAYNRRCALTGEKTLPVLQASHIKPYAESGPHEVSNGLLMRSDLHLLFDRGLITITPDHHIEVSNRIREQWQNGREYYALHGERLRVLPSSTGARPRREFVEWHNEMVFRQT